jgi:hypothetical protein
MSTSTGSAALIFASATFAVAAHSCSLDFFFSTGVGDVADLLALLPALMTAVPPPLQKSTSSPRASAWRARKSIISNQASPALFFGHNGRTAEQWRPQCVHCKSAIAATPEPCVGMHMISSVLAHSLTAACACVVCWCAHMCGQLTPCVALLTSQGRADTAGFCAHLLTHRQPVIPKRFFALLFIQRLVYC